MLEKTFLDIGKQWAPKLHSYILLATLGMIISSTGAAAGQTDGRQGEDFAADAKLLYRVVACGGDAALPANLDPHDRQPPLPADQDAHGALPARLSETGQGLSWPPCALVLCRIPWSIPFGGGDLLAALTTYPDARRDYHPVPWNSPAIPGASTTIDNKRLDESLDHIDHNVAVCWPPTTVLRETLMDTQQGDLPGQLSYFLVALAVHGFEPVSLRYFHVPARWLSALLFRGGCPAPWKPAVARARHGKWTSPDFSEAFANSELVFRPIGGGPLRVHRHIGANLRDDSLRQNGPILTYLRKQGRIVAMTKAASYCLWNPSFSRIRNYLLANMVFMISDGTGIPPELARRAGFVEETYGSFKGAMCFDDCPNLGYSDQFRDLWASQPQRKLGFRYGYVDSKGSYHLLVTRRAPAAKL